MMHMLRKAAAFIMFAVLIGAFAISMGGNNYFDRYRKQTIASVGSVDITPDQYDRAYRRVLDGLSQRAGHRISSQEAKSFGLPNRVLQGIIQDAAVDWEAEKLGLGVSDAGLRQSITNAQMFQDAARNVQPAKISTVFAADRLQRALLRAGVQGRSDQAAVAGRLRKERPSSKGAAGSLQPLSETSSARFSTSRFPQKRPGTIEAPSEATLKTFYDERKAQFMAPEFRKVAVLAITAQTIASRMTVSDDELKAEYDAKAADYAVPERRKIELIPFKTRAAADAAHAELKAGKRFLDVAKEAGFKQPELDIGLVSKKEFAKKFATNDAIIEEAFTTDKGWTSRPVDGPLSTVIMRVLEIVPGQEKSFAEVKEQIRADLLKARSTAESSKLIKAFEEDRATGVVLADSAKKLNLPLEEVTFDRTGKGPGGKPVELAGVPVAAIVDAAFKSDVGVENDALRVPGGGYAWYEVEEIVKPRQKPFDEVKSDVEAAWRKDQIRTQLAEKARDLVARLNRGEPIADVAKSAGAEVKTSQPVKREGSGDGLPTAAVGQAFTLGEHGASSAASADGEARVVFEVEKIVLPPPLNEAQARGIEQQLARQLGDDNYSAYLSGIMKTAGVSVDHKTFASVVGGSYEGGE